MPSQESSDDMEEDCMAADDDLTEEDANASSVSQPDQLYRSCSLGHALTDVLREMVQEGQMTPAQALQVEKQYDTSMSLGMKTLVKQYKVRPAFHATETESHWKRKAKKLKLAQESRSGSAPLVPAVPKTQIQGTIDAVNSVNGQWRFEAHDVLIKHPTRSMRVPNMRMWLVEEEPEPPALARAKPLP